MDETARLQYFEALVELRNANLAVWNGHAADGAERANGTLDSSLKRNTAFIKKVRLSLNADNLDSLKSDLQAVSLEKYLSELVSGVAESLGKVKLTADIRAAVELASLLHQRFGARFSLPLTLQLLRQLAVPPQAYLSSLAPEQRDKEETSRVVRQRPLLRVAFELWLVGVVRTVQDAIDASGGDAKKRKVDEAVPLYCLRELVAADKTFTNISLVANIAKHYGLFLPQSSSTSTSTATLISDDDRRHLLGLIKSYYDVLVPHLRQQARTIARDLERFEENTIQHGSVSATREQALQDLRKTHEKQSGHLHTIAEALGETVPSFNTTNGGEDADSLIRGVGTSVRKGDQDGSADSVWEDEDERRFYGEIAALKDVVPSDLLTDGKQPVAESSTPADLDQSIDDDELMEDDAALATEEPAPVADEPEVATTAGAKLTSLLLRLPDLNNKDLIDSASVEFAFLNSKASRNRLQKALIGLPPQRTDILPFYARLVASLNQHLPTLGDFLVDHLHKEFRRFLRHPKLCKDLTLRMFNIRYLSELIKFSIVPLHVTFHILKVLSDVLDVNNAEILAVMLESCGRFLTRHHDTASRMQTQLDLIMRKAKASTGLQRPLLENAFYSIYPPERQSIAQKVRSNEELYARKLIAELSVVNKDKTLTKLRKFPWRESAIERLMFKIFSKPWKINYGTISQLAWLLAGLRKHHSAFVLRVLDAALEEVVHGLETNVFSANQSRIAAVKYLSEMLNVGLIDRGIVFATLDLLLTLGHEDGRPTPEGCAIDSPDDLFRLRLVSTVINACAGELTKAAPQQQHKVELLIARLQHYIQTKRQLPREVELGMVDTLRRLKPKLELEESLEAATQKLDTVLASMPAPSADAPDSTAAAADIDSSSSSSDSDGDDNDNDGSDAEAEDGTSTPTDLDAAAAQGAAEAEAVAEPETDYDTFVLLEKKRAQDDLDRAAEDELSREFAKMMADAVDLAPATRKPDAKRVVDIAIPRRALAADGAAVGGATGGAPGGIMRRSAQSTSGLAASGSGSVGESAGRGDEGAPVRFTMLARRGKARTLALPADSRLVLAQREQRERDLAEQRHIKDLVMQYEDNYAADDELLSGASSASNGTVGGRAPTVRYSTGMISGQKGGLRSGSMFRMGPQPNRGQ